MITRPAKPRRERTDARTSHAAVHRVFRKSVAAAALIPLLVACGSGDDDATSDPVTSEPTAEDQAQGVTEAPATVLTSGQAEAVLLPAEDLDDLFVEIPSDTSEDEAATEDLGCLAQIDDPAGEPVASASRDYEGVLAFGTMRVASYETTEELASSFDVGKEALATCGMETIDGIAVEVSYDPEATGEPIEGVDDQIFVDMHGVMTTEGIEADVIISLAMIRIENNAVTMMLADIASDPSGHAPLDPVDAAQQAADRLRAVMEGDDPTPSAAPAPGPGTYEFEYMGAVGTIEVPTDTAHPAVAEFEEYRQAVGGEPVTYFVAEVDNTNGTETINMYQIVVVSEDGEQIEAQSVDWVIGDWMDTVGTETNEQIDLYNWGVDLTNAQLGGLLPGAKDTMVLAASEPVDSVRRVYVYPAGGFDQVEATKSGR